MTNPALARAAAFGDAEIEPPHQHSGGGALLVRASAIALADRKATRAAPDQAGYRGALIRKKCP
jgi:hypothetical protein